MDQAGLSANIVETAFDPDEVYRHARNALEAPSPPTAVFATSDEIAFPVLAAMSDLGLQPGLDVSVIGIDDHPDAEKLDLTPYGSDPHKGPTPARSRLFPTTVVSRDSSRSLKLR